MCIICIFIEQRCVIWRERRGLLHLWWKWIPRFNICYHLNEACYYHIPPVGNLVYHLHAYHRANEFIFNGNFKPIIHFFMSQARCDESRVICLEFTLWERILFELLILRNSRNLFKTCFEFFLWYLKTGSWGEYLGPRVMRMGSGEGSTMRNFIVCTVHLI